MRKFAIISLYAILFLFAQSAQAQTATPTKKQELLKELITAVDAGNMATKVMDSMLSEMHKQYPIMINQMADADTTLTADQRKKMKESVNESYERFSKVFEERLKQKIDLNKFMEDITYSLYDKFFTEDEIKDLIAFYKTSTGKKALSVLPQLSTESLQIVNEKLTPTLITIVTEILTEEEKRIKP